MLKKCVQVDLSNRQQGNKDIAHQVSNLCSLVRKQQEQ